MQRQPFECSIFVGNTIKRIEGGITYVCKIIDDKYSTFRVTLVCFLAYNYISRYSDNEGSFGKSMGLNSDPSDSEESDDDDIQGTSNAQPVELYNPKDFEDLDVSAEVRELFQNIMRYLPDAILQLISIDETFKLCLEQKQNETKA